MWKHIKVDGRPLPATLWLSCSDESIVISCLLVAWIRRSSKPSPRPYSRHCQLENPHRVSNRILQTPRPEFQSSWALPLRSSSWLFSATPSAFTRSSSFRRIGTGLIVSGIDGDLHVGSDPWLIALTSDLRVGFREPSWSLRRSAQMSNPVVQICSIVHFVAAVMGE